MSAFIRVNPYLHFDGDFEEAIAFYAATLGGTIALRKTYADMPMPGLPRLHALARPRRRRAPTRSSRP